MNKKGIIWLVIAIVIIIIAIAGYTIYRNTVTKEEKPNIENLEDENIEETNNINNTNRTNENREASNNGNKTLVVYYSAQLHTKAVAEKIAENLEADIFEIIPEEVYTTEDLNWTNENSRVVKEHDDESLRNIKLKNTKVDNWEDYNTVLIGYPIWWRNSSVASRYFCKSK